MALTQEQKLKELLTTIATNPKGYIAGHIYISKISKQNKTPQKIKVALSILEKYFNSANSSVFALSNDDIVIIAKGNFLKNLYKSLDEIKRLFSNDLIVINDYEDSFSRIFSFDYQFDEYYKKVMLIVEEVDSFGLGVADASTAMTPESLDQLSLKLETTDISNYIKKQEVIAIGKENIGKIFFQEFYISLDKLKQALGVNINLTSDKWLFRHFSELLDRKMLTTLTNLNLEYDGYISLNLNLKSVDSPEFKQFMRQYRRPIIIELQISDIFEDIRYYEKIRKLCHDNGHKIAIDSVNDETLELLDVKLLTPDYIKITWNSGYVQNTSNIEKVQDIVRYIGSDKIILCRCPNEEAIKWGLSRDISVYQGHFVDSIVGAMIKKQCDSQSRCELKDCIARRHFVSSTMQEGCYNISHLNKNPQIKIGALK